MRKVLPQKQVQDLQSRKRLILPDKENIHPNSRLTCVSNTQNLKITSQKKSICPLSSHIGSIKIHYHVTKNTNKAQENWLKNQTEINRNMRVILIDWLCLISHKYGLRRRTLHLAVNILDRVCALKEVSKMHYQLLGLASLFISCKFEEIGVPTAADLCHWTDGYCIPAQLINTETEILSLLKFELVSVLPVDFLEIFDFVEKEQIGLDELKTKTHNLITKDFSLALTLMLMCDFPSELDVCYQAEFAKDLAIFLKTGSDFKNLKAKHVKALGSLKEVYQHIRNDKNSFFAMVDSRRCSLLEELLDNLK